MSKVSVIIPVWDKPHLLMRPIHSVLTQTHQDFEILVVGDGCPSEMLQKYESVVVRFGDSRIQLYNLSEHRPCNKNTTGAWPRNYALDIATGDFIAPLDDDDMFLPYHLEDCLKIIERERVDFVYGQFLDIGLKRRDAIIHGRGLEEGFEKSLIGHPTVVYGARYRHLKYQDVKRGGADRRLWTDLYEAGAKMYFSPKIHAIHYSIRV